ncbi:uncharacterized protein LOC108911166 [Anoplophora glabripennis]|uniref:uncharacterized protein LOC108911166 n=1 Tax=Anoplophora glabripennis TaxID=217634 RepID=UPI00087387B4|nr:uncharacterized protein LOC108911166 [Anoplophora glabripennis]
MAMRRFIGRRGKPAHMYSDNGKNFVGANSDLKELGNMLKQNSDSLSEILANEDVNWHFIPPYSLHFGGLWEAAVRSTKFHLKRVAGNAHLTFEEMYTLLVQVESILNSRPLSPISASPIDLTPLTPAHFLIGCPLTSLPDRELENVPTNRLVRYQRIQQTVQHFWSRWKKEYLSELHQRQKNHRGPQFVNVGDLVLLRDENLPPLRWRLGRVKELHPGAHGIARVITIQTANGPTKRAATQVCPLPDVSEGNRANERCGSAQGHYTE